MRDSRLDDGGGTPFGIGVGIGAAVMVAATATAAALFPPADVSARLVVVAVAVGAHAVIVADPRANLVTAVLGFLLFDGFLANRYGELTWNGTTSGWHVAVFVLAAGAGIGWRRIRTARADLALADELAGLVDNSDTRTRESHGG